MKMCALASTEIFVTISQGEVQRTFGSVVQVSLGFPAKHVI